LQGLVRLAAEESSGRLGLVLASRYGRSRWWLSSMGLLAVEVLFAGGLARAAPPGNHAPFEVDIVEGGRGRAGKRGAHL
jgi:hypothetical protein